MAEELVQVTGHCAAEPAELWAVAGDFCGLWHPAIDEIRAERDGRGALIRAFTVKGEDTLYREQLTYRSDSDRVLAYSHLEGISGAERYVARLQVSPAEQGGSLIEWSARISAAPERLAAIASGTKAIFEMGIEALAGVKKDPSPTPPHKGEGLDVPLSPNSKRSETAPRVFSPLVGEMADRPEEDSSLGTRGAARSETTVIEGNPRLALTVTSPKDGPLVLFLHGIGGGRTNWLPQLAAVAPQLRAAALDLRGYGESQLGATQSTVDDYCADILRIMDSLGVERIVLCGLSYGAWIATSFAMRHPDKLAGLVLSGGCTGMSEAGVEEREAFRRSRQVPLDEGKTPADFAAAVVQVLAGPEAGDDVRRRLLNSMAAIPAATYRDALNCFTRPPERFDFSRLTMPVLMMTGEHDRLAPPAEIRGVAGRIAEAAPNASVRFEMIAAAGHVCNVERPDAYNAVLTDFLSELAR